MNEQELKKRVQEVAGALSISNKSAKKLLVSDKKTEGKAIVEILTAEISRKYKGHEKDVPEYALSDLLKGLAWAKYPESEQIVIELPNPNGPGYTAIFKREDAE